ncbi:hypothetical protein Ptr902_05388 [Pyrenophora tritici-repentis]|nr:hypothetical protein Ptr902_05388 [Pyrenophora tritici-repentis]
MSLVRTLITTLLLTPSLALPLSPWHRPFQGDGFPLIPWYRVFRDDGSPSAGWPTQEDWLPFDDAWLSLASRSSILSTATKSSIPAEFILAIIMQESRDCVRAPTTEYAGNQNPGLMQTAGHASCHPSNAEPMSQCPNNMIGDMINEGTMGRGSGMNLRDALSAFNDEGATKYYKAARRYNPGAGVTSMDMGVGSTPCYASDVANWLVGGMYSRDGKTGCDNASVRL